MKTIVKIAFSENTSMVLAETKIECESEPCETIDYDSVLKKGKEIFEDAQKFAITKSMQKALSKGGK